MYIRGRRSTAVIAGVNAAAVVAELWDEGVVRAYDFDADYATPLLLTRPLVTVVVANLD